MSVSYDRGPTQRSPVQRAPGPGSLAELLNEVRGWAKGTLPTYQDRKQFFESIVGGDPDPVELLRRGDELTVRELIVRAQAEAEARLAGAMTAA